MIPELPEELFPDSISTDPYPAVVPSLPQPLFSEIDVPSPPSVIPAFLRGAGVNGVHRLEGDSEDTSVQAVHEGDFDRCVLNEEEVTALAWELDGSILVDQVLAMPSSVLEQFVAETSEQFV